MRLHERRVGLSCHSGKQETDKGTYLSEALKQREGGSIMMMINPIRSSPTAITKACSSPSHGLFDGIGHEREASRDCWSRGGTGALCPGKLNRKAEPKKTAKHAQGGGKQDEHTAETTPSFMFFKPTSLSFPWPRDTKEPEEVQENSSP